MPTIITSIVIERPVEAVFDFVTTPANWPLWHPSSLAVSEGAEHPLRLGEEVREEFIAAGRRGAVTWRVRFRDPPRRWIIDCVPEAGGFAAIAYDLTAEGGATRFTRTLTYAMPSLAWSLVDLIVLRRRLRRESTFALSRLRELMISEEAHCAGIERQSRAGEERASLLPSHA